MFLEANRQRIETEFGQLAERLPSIYEEISERLKGLNENTVLAMKYLYITMPYSDIGNYPFETFLDYAAHGVRLYEEHEEVQKLPEQLFLNYVLYHRINEEEIKPCRSFFYEKLKNRVKGQSGKDAAQEVNYWCVEEVTYQCTDDRTLSPIDVYRRGNGRCGEESTFSVSALRCVGIPARQVYAPQWSHCDDNHAWVEVWCDGAWYFTGACEPVPILNKGWFTNASSRAMMVHSRWFDSLPSEEEKIGEDGMVTMLNELPRYAAVKRVSVYVADEHGNPVDGAEIDFEVLNYAEFASVARCITDEKGYAGLTTGYGSLHLHIRKEQVSTDCFIDTRETSCCNIVLKDCGTYGKWYAHDMAAPVDTPVNTDMPTKAQQIEGDKRLLEAARLRQIKTENWMHLDRKAFLEGGEAGKAADRALREHLLSVLTEKDQTDYSRHVLEEHVELALPFRDSFPEDIFVQYVLNPRIDDEILTAFRRHILEAFTAEEKTCFYSDPKQIWKWIISNIRTCPERERLSLITAPSACLKLKIASLLSQKVLFVAVARTLGIGARLNPQDRSMEYLQADTFIPVIDGTEKNCCLTLTGDGRTVWTYFQNWTIAKKEDGRYRSLKLAGINWQEHTLTVPLEAGEYRILTTNRLPNGNQFLNQHSFCLEEGDSKEIALELRDADLSDMLENISVSEFQIYRENQIPADASDITDGNKKILLWLEEGKEPTEHILNEMMERKSEFIKYVEQIVFIIRTKDALEDPTLSKALKALPGVRVFYDDFKTNVNTLGRRMYVDHEKLPLIIVTNGKLNGIYATSGYNVGTGDMLLRLMELE